MPHTTAGSLKNAIPACTGMTVCLDDETMRVIP